MHEEYKPNSHRYKEEQKRALPPETEKVVTGDVKPRKKNGIQRFAKSLFSEDFNLTDYIYREVVVPKARDMLYKIVDEFLDGIKDAASSALYGKDKRPDNDRRPYHSYYEGEKNYEREARTVTYRHIDYDDEYDDIIFERRGDAERTLQELRDNIEHYGLASVANLYSAVGKRVRPTDNDYGWDDLSRARVSPTFGGYVINLPRAKYIGDEN